MTDRMDERLRRHAEAWQASLPAPVAPALADRSPRVWPLAAAAAAAVLAIVVGGLALRGGQHEATPAHTDHVVPWKALPATHPVLPVRSPAPAPIPEGTPRCEPGDLQLVDDVLEDGAGGTAYRTYSVTARHTCRTRGYPAVVPLAKGEPLDVDVIRADADNDPPVADVLVGPDRSAAFTVSWAVSHHCPVVDNTSLRIGLQGTTVVTSGFGRSTCDSEGRQVMRVTALNDPQHAAQEPVGPWDAVQVSGDLDLTLDPGQRARFEVTLESPRDLPLVPCPDYSVVTAAGVQAWGLNCAGVPYRRDGQPYLPAGTPVTFAMEADTGDRSTPKFLWVLTDTPTSVAGRLTVQRPQVAGSIEGTVEVGGGPGSTGGTFPLLRGTVTLRGPSYSRTAEVVDGDWRLADVPAGTYTAEVTSPDYAAGTFSLDDDVVTVSDAGTATPHLSLTLR